MIFLIPKLYFPHLNVRMIYIVLKFGENKQSSWYRPVYMKYFKKRDISYTFIDFIDLWDLLKTDKVDDLVIMGVDVYQGLCEVDAFEYRKIDDYIRNVSQQVCLISGSTFLEVIGKKLYTADPSFQKFMVPGTMVYPFDREEIEGLPRGKYVLKFGMASASMGVFIEKDVDGEMIISEILSISAASTYEKRKEHAEKVLRPFARMASGALCADNIVIVQPYQDIFERCYETRFYVTDKIVGINVVSGYDINAHHPNHVVQKFRKKGIEIIGRKINPKVYRFVHSIISLLKEKYPLYVSARIDIIIDCLEEDALDVLNPTFKGDIYLNEIEPLAESARRMAFPVKDNFEEAVISKLPKFPSGKVDIEAIADYDYSPIIGGFDQSLDEILSYYESYKESLDNIYEKYTDKFNKKDIGECLKQTAKNMNTDLYFIIKALAQGD
jgi:hypothetical protein